jgi:hypothetical protein
MISNVVVSYQLKPEAMAEHIRLIEAVFAQLHREKPQNLEYKVVRLDDGVSFVHISTADTPDGANPPAPTGAALVGSYVPADGALGQH